MTGFKIGERTLATYIYGASNGYLTDLNYGNGQSVEYSYDSWGNILSATGEKAEENPFRYRGYYYDEETRFYYVTSRYYDSEIGRWINADNFSMLGVNGDVASLNLFAYCGNNPICRKDIGGHFWDFVLDVVSLVSSVCEVVNNPTDVGAWVGLAFDVVDVAVPFVGGLGETARVVGAAMEFADSAHDTENIIETTTDTVKLLHRPYIRKSTREAVEKAATKLPDGRFLDANTLLPINGKYDLGHVYGHEFWRERERAMSLGWTQKQFNDYMNNPIFYQIEDPISNRSHFYEMR